MNRARKGGAVSRVEEDIPDELRCKRSDGKQWRCNARAMENKTLCEKHYNQAKKRAAGSTGNTSPKKKGKIKDVASPEVLHLNKMTGDARNRAPNRATADRPSKAYAPGQFSGGSDVHASYKHLDYRTTGDYRQANDYKAHKDLYSGRQCLLNGSPIGFDERSRPLVSPLRDSYFKDELALVDEGMYQQSDICHQCQMSDRNGLISCLQCGKKSYCLQCISKWYPPMDEEDVRQSCPHCRGFCNCKACVLLDEGVSMFAEMKLLNGADKVKYLKYMLTFIQPLLQEFHDEQSEEMYLEMNLTGDESLKAERTKVMKDERLYCDNCNTQILDFYRSCPSCGYDLCLRCCYELRQGQQPGGESANSADQPCVARLKRSLRGHDCRLPVWCVNFDSNIPCPPSERGGCGSSSLILKRLLKSNWIAKLLDEVNHIIPLGEKKSVLSDVWCSCRLDSDTDSNFNNFDKHLRMASHRADNNDNYIYCPTSQHAQKEGIEHFQSHWFRGEPVIVRGIFQEAQGLKWEPLVLWRAFRDSTRSKSMAVLDCLDWCLVEVSVSRFFKGYLKGLMHKTRWPELLKLKDPLPSSLIEEKLPRLGFQLMRALPFYEYTNARHGVLNLASKVPDDCLRPDYGPKTSIAYGLKEELGKGDSVTKLHYDMSDTVTVLVHSTEIKLPAWQASRLDKFKAEYKKALAAESMQPGDLPAKLLKERDSQTVLKEEFLGESCTENDKENREPWKSQVGGMKELDVYGGVLWDVFRRQDVPRLVAYLSRHLQDFRYGNGDVLDQVTHPIHDQILYLTKEHKMKLKQECGIEPWTFEQRVGEAVFIPAGCPYQTRNMKSVINVMLEFTSPESLQELVRLSNEVRFLPKGHAAKDVKLEVQKLMLYAANRAVKNVRHLMSNER
ncbi:hypothetical protein KP509_23G014800 [Ceratopteris richardii]|uniref:Lysine-specific demethylase JMJ25 n=2 Tax=Ceratopteris richardii TaxID=49495 RepID=A0A8T2S092_CERRI|nr:hypothetical protein KP509_23G014800 [Ceratopteris richardii]KAH7301152.1 hypothetical protein KP509_23G014800 [Ceratopteris richardii]KAH7301154.1 hypothetical protein KP509_23G014800 [Ceratopteris richardii]KAH7301156.1 hypothetical protein KP509_23G014800 [Ceratopteris richardii]KAH7301158.1 hypothetical protein KP509_23G014800 [Ceratopteris richardii]